MGWTHLSYEDLVSKIDHAKIVLGYLESGNSDVRMAVDNYRELVIKQLEGASQERLDRLSQIVDGALIKARQDGIDTSDFERLKVFYQRRLTDRYHGRQRLLQESWKEKVIRFLEFTGLVAVPFWYNSPSATKATLRDLLGQFLEEHYTRTRAAQGTAIIQ